MIFRITPTYAMSLAVYIALMPNIGSGPFWEGNWQEENRRCKQSWIYNLLYLNNFISYDNFVSFLIFRHIYCINDKC